LEHPVDRLSHRQHRPNGALCAAGRRHHSVPNDRYLGTLHARRIAAASASRAGASAAADLRCAAPSGNLERRRVVGARGRRSGAGSGVCRRYGALGEGLSLGVARLLRARSARHDSCQPIVGMRCRLLGLAVVASSWFPTHLVHPPNSFR